MSGHWQHGAFGLIVVVVSVVVSVVVVAASVVSSSCRLDSEATCDFLLSRRLRLKRHQNRKWQFNLSALIEFYFPRQSPFWCGDWFALCCRQRLHLQQLRLSRVFSSSTPCLAPKPVPGLSHVVAWANFNYGLRFGIMQARPWRAQKALCDQRKLCKLHSYCYIAPLTPAQWFFLIFFGFVYTYSAHFLIAFHYLRQITIEPQSGEL